MALQGITFLNLTLNSLCDTTFFGRKYLYTIINISVSNDANLNVR